jgi:aspartate aminotransferase
MRFSNRVSQVSPSVTLGLNARTLELRRQGRDIVSLGVGEPDIDTPELVCQAAVDAIAKRKARYTATAGIPALRQAICKYLQEVYGVGYAPAEVMASSGAKQVLYNSVLVSTGPGEELIIPTPYWTSYPEMVHLASGIPVIVETVAGEGFKLTPEKLEGAITSATRAVLLNSPSNPTGVTYTLRDLEALAEVLRPRDLWVLSDDIYCNLLYDRVQFASMAQVSGMRDKTILINGVSKTFSMTGWRIGFAAGSQDLIEAMTKIQDHATSCPNAIAQYAAAAALDAGPGLTAEWVSTLGQRRDLMVSLVNDIPGLSCSPPEGAFYLWVDATGVLNRGHHATTMELAEGLLVEAGVATVPGEAFGTRGFLRLSFAVTLDDIREGLARIATYLARH